VTAALVRRVLGDGVAGDAPTLPSSRSGDHGSGASDVPDVADAADAVDAAEAAGLKERMEAYERRLVREALERVGGNKARAARELGVGVRTLYKMLERLGL
jgi:two-component system response regulator HydG